MRHSSSFPDIHLDDLNGIVSLTKTEIKLLSTLEPHAKAVAPILSQVFSERMISRLSESSPEEKEMIKGYIQQWFVNLFKDCPMTERGFGRHARALRALPFRYTLLMMDQVLNLGDEVVSRCVNSDLARKAFQKRLAQSLATEEMDEEQHQNMLMEMILAD